MLFSPSWVPEMLGDSHPHPLPMSPPSIPPHRERETLTLTPPHVAPVESIHSFLCCSMLGDEVSRTVLDLHRMG